MKALDVAEDTSGQAHALLDAGYQAVGLYLRPDRSSKAMADGLALVGIKRFSVYEKGQPTSSAYFNETQGKADSIRAINAAKAIGQPTGTHIFAAVDYDASVGDLQVPILDYFRAFHDGIKTAGYICSVYGSGLVCTTLIRLGYANKGWLAQSTGWAWFEKFKPSAAIVQGPTSTVLGMDVDTDQIIDPTVCW